MPWIIVAIIAIGLYSWGKGFNNTAVELKESATKSWGDVESSYQRRNDLIGNLVKTVQGAADFERTTLREVIEARAKATSTTIDASNLNAENMAQFQQAQSGLSGALSKLLVSVERYPDIKANQNFLELQAQLEGTENRINVARDRFNEAVEPYNKHIKTFPNMLLAGLFNFEHSTKLDAFDRAKEVFHMLKMDNTKLQNGVLLYVAVTDRTFVIYGDEGINNVVENDFWDSTRDAILKQFKEHNFKQGLIDGILKAGKALEKHFPWHIEDTNELPNTISKG